MFEEEQSDRDDDNFGNKQGITVEDVSRDNSLVALGKSIFPESEGDTVPPPEKKNGAGKLILGRAAVPDKPMNPSNFMAEGHSIELRPQEQIDRNYTAVQHENNFMPKGRSSDLVGSSPTAIDITKPEKDDDLTTRAIRACLAAEAVMAALRDECSYLQPGVTDDDPQGKGGHARRDCKCSGKGATCNGTLSLQLQLAACENLSLAATAAFRELVAARLGVPMAAALRGSSPRKQRKKSKKINKTEKPTVAQNSKFGQTTVKETKVDPRRFSARPNNETDSKGNVSKGQEQLLSQGPFSCSHPPLLCSGQNAVQCVLPFSCNCSPSVVAGARPSCFRGMTSNMCDILNSINPSYAMLADEDKSRGDADSVPGSEASIPPKFKILFCDMDGTLLNSKSMITQKTANALKKALKTGVQVIIATGKTRPAALAVLETVGLAGEGGVLSDSTPGVFLQGLQVYGNGGALIHSERLDPFVVTETFEFSVEHQSPLIGFSGDRCVTLFPHTLVDALHDIYYEPKAEVLECMDQINKVRVQKVLFYDTAERVASFLRPHWTLAVNGRATVVQALPEMMEILPAGASKGIGVQRLLDHLGVPVDQVMAIGDGENDIEMLAMVGWGVAMANGTERTKSVAQAITSSNDEDGVAKAIEDYIL